jgi:lysozyme
MAKIFDKILNYALAGAIAFNVGVGARHLYNQRENFGEATRGIKTSIETTLTEPNDANSQRLTLEELPGLPEGDQVAEGYLSQQKKGNKTSEVYDKEFCENQPWIYNTYSDIERHEGKRNWVYDDATGKRIMPGEKAIGNRTIGVGLNLERKGAREEIEKLGLNFYEIYSGKQPVGDDHIQIFLRKDMKTAEKDARKYIPNFDSLDENAKSVITNMAFNMGYNRLSQFKEMRKALLSKDYKLAAREMENSRWYRQVGNRGEELVETMKNSGRE